MLEVGQILEHPISKNRFLIKTIDNGNNSFQFFDFQLNIDISGQIDTTEEQIKYGRYQITQFKIGDKWTLKNDGIEGFFKEITLQVLIKGSSDWIWDCTFPDGKVTLSEPFLIKNYDPPSKEIIKSNFVSNCKCNLCKEPAFILFNSCECSNLKCRNYKS